MRFPSIGTIITWAVIAIVVLAIVKHPDQAGGLVHSIGNGLSNAANGLSTFIAKM